MLLSMNPFRIAAESPEDHSPARHAHHDGCEACMPNVTKSYDRYGMKSTWAHPFECFACIHCGARWYANAHVETCFLRMRELEEKNKKWDELFTVQIEKEMEMRKDAARLRLMIWLLSIGIWSTLIFRLVSR